MKRDRVFPPELQHSTSQGMGDSVKGGISAGPLSGMKFVIVGKTSKSKVALNKQISSLGGQVVPKVAADIAACISTTGNYFCVQCTVEPLLKDHPIGLKNVVCQDRWSLVTSSVILKCKSFCQKCMICQHGCSLMAVVSQDRFHFNRVSRAMSKLF